jgi:hypothetical protein
VASDKGRRQAMEDSAVAVSCWEPCICTGTNSPPHAGIYAVSLQRCVCAHGINLEWAGWHSDIFKRGSVHVSSQHCCFPACTQSLQQML